MAKKTPPPVDDIEVVEKPGLGIDEGIILATTVLLIAAVVIVRFAIETQYPV